MAVIKSKAEQRNPDGNGITYQQKITVTGATASDEYILPPVGSHSFAFATTGTGTIQVSLSSLIDIEAGNGIWVDNDLSEGPALSVSKLGSFKACTGIRINNASGTSSIEIKTRLS